MSEAKQPVRKSVLGRGLAALIQEADSVTSFPHELPVNHLNFISLDQIEINTFQPRSYFDEQALHELAESIKVQGIIQPITVRRLGSSQYQIISGERRYRASRMAGLVEIPAYIREANDQQMLEMAIIENIQRQDLNPIEVAISYQRLIAECSLKQEDLGERVGKNRSSVTNYLRLLKLPPDIQIAVRDGKISFGHARAIITVEHVEDQLAIFKKILTEELSVRKTEELVRYLQDRKQSQSPKKSLDNSSQEVKKIQNKLSAHFGTKVFIKTDEQYNGELKIPFYSAEDLNRILEIIQL